MRLARRVLSPMLALGLVLGVAGTAQAAAEETGNLGCHSKQVGRTTTYSTGATSHYPPGAGFGKFYNGSAWKTTVKNGTARGCGDGFWWVKTTGSMNKSKTYATARYAG